MAKFDVIVSFQVLEHVPDPKSFLTHAVKLLRPNGKLILAVPNANGLPGIADSECLSYICGVKFSCGYEATIQAAKTCGGTDAVEAP